MNHKSIMLLMVALLTTISTHAYDFLSEHIYYDITGSNTVEVKGGDETLKNRSTVAIPETVTYNGTTYSVTGIGNSAFEYYISLGSITIPESVTSIGSSAFFYCPALRSISIPNSVIHIGEGAFLSTYWYNNQPDGLLYINNVLYCYKGEMPENTSINVREGTISITAYAFQLCSTLTSFNIPNSVISIGESAFNLCSGLTSVTLSNSLTTIEESTFNRCTALTSISIPNSVTSIGVSAFNTCTGLTSLTIPESVTTIEKSAFGNCANISDITCMASVPPTCEQNSFDKILRTTPLHVPARSAKAYKAAAVWQEFALQPLPPIYTPVDLVSLAVNGETVEDFAPEELTYETILPAGTTDIPQIDATAYNASARVLLLQATTLPGQASAVVITNDSIQTYTVRFTVAAPAPSDDATLAALAYGAMIPSFTADNSHYDVLLSAETTAAPETFAIANDPNATVSIEQATELPGTATITVTAADGSVSAYTVTYTKQAPPSAVENTASQQDATAVTKIITNGQVLIVRGENTYDILGKSL